MVEVDPCLGTEIAGYRIEAPLGRSGISVVYLARDERLNRPVALKLLSPELSTDERFRERFLRESRLSASLDHSNIVPVYEAGEAEGHLYIATRYVEGTDLASLLAGEGRLEPGRTLLIVTTLAEALDAARWGRGLVHGSLKPSDVLLVSAADTASRERVFLLGFGLRRELPPGATLAEAPRHLGVLDYLAPEQIEGKPVSPRTDIYALGCILFECLTGETPFKGDSPDALLTAHLHEQPPSATRYCPDLPAGIDRLIGTAMAKWPEERYSTCGELAASAQAILAPSGEQSEGAPIDERLSRLALSPGAARAEELPPSRETPGSSVLAVDSLLQRFSRSKGKSIAAVGFVVLLAALVAGAIWLTGRDTGDARSAAPVLDGAGDGLPSTSTAALRTEPDRSPDEPAAPAQLEPMTAGAALAEPADGGAGQPFVSLGPGGLVRIDATTGEILARAAIPSPKLLASDGRSVWVVSDEGAGERLVQIDAATNAVSGTFDVGGVAASGLAATGGSAWLNDRDGSVYRLAPGASAAEPVTLVDPDGVTLDFVRGSQAAAGSLWVSAYPSGPHTFPPDLYRVDPATGRVIARIGAAQEAVAAGTGFVWALEDDPGRLPGEYAGLLRIDTETQGTVPIGVLEFPWADLAFARGAVWASSPEDGTIVRLDSVTGEERGRVRVGRVPGVLAAGAGAVWAVMSNEGTVTRYDIAADRLETIYVGGTPTDLVFAGDSVWVSVGGGSGA